MDTFLKIMHKIFFSYFYDIMAFVDILSNFSDGGADDSCATSFTVIVHNLVLQGKISSSFSRTNGFITYLYWIAQFQNPLFVP